MSQAFIIESEVHSCIIKRRINRFLVEASVEGKEELIHLNNTGRLKELIVKGRKCFCYEIKGRRARHRLYAVEEEDSYALVDTLLQEKSFESLAGLGALPWLGGCWHIKKKPRVENNVYDYLMACSTGRYLIEVKSATLRIGKVYASYPDTKTDRGVRHIYRLPIDSERLNAKALLVFIAGLRGVSGVIPNIEAEPRILDALKASMEMGLIVRGLSIFIEERRPNVIVVDSPDIPLKMYQE